MTAKTPRKRTTKAGVVVKKEATQVTVPSEPTPAPEPLTEPEVLPVIEEAPTPLIVETAPPMVKEEQPEARWYILRYLPENVGTPDQVRRGWSAALKELDKLIKGSRLQYGLCSHEVEGVRVRYILAEKELISYLTEKHPKYVEGGCPEYRVSNFN